MDESRKDSVFCCTLFARYCTLVQVMCKKCLFVWFFLFAGHLLLNNRKGLAATSPFPAKTILAMYKLSIPYCQHWHNGQLITFLIHSQSDQAVCNERIPDRYHFCTASTERSICSAACSCVMRFLPQSSMTVASCHGRFARVKAKSTRGFDGYLKNATTSASRITPPSVGHSRPSTARFLRVVSVCTPWPVLLLLRLF